MKALRRVAAYSTLIAMMATLPACSQNEDRPRVNRVVYALDWKAGMDYAGVYAAKDRGYFASEGLEVEIIQGHGGPDAAKLLANGTNKIGNCTGDALAIGVSKGMEITSLAVTHQKSPVVIFALSDSGIDDPQSLIGKKIGVNYESIKFHHYIALLETLNIDRGKIEEIGVGWDITPLLSGQVDALLGYVGDEPIQAIKAGKEVTIISLSDYGIEMYNECIAVNNQWFLENGETAKKMLRAVLRGWQFVVENPNEAALMMKRLFPEQDAELNKLSIDRILPLLESADTELRGLGAQSHKGWQNTIDLLVSRKLIEEPPSAEDLFNNEVFQTLVVPAD